MADRAFDEELLQQVHSLQEEQQLRVLEFARTLARSTQLKGESGQSFLKSIGLFNETELDEMTAAIEEDCERIDWSGWE